MTGTEVALLLLFLWAIGAMRRRYLKERKQWLDSER